MFSLQRVFLFSHFDLGRIKEQIAEKRILEVQSCELYNNKYTIALLQITNTEILAFTTVLVFNL